MKTKEEAPSLSKCILAIRQICAGNGDTEDMIMHKGRWLYIMNLLSFWNDLPVLLDIIRFEQAKVTVEKDKRIAELEAQVKRLSVDPVVSNPASFEGTAD